MARMPLAKSKGRRWRKGDSCSSNPQTKTHRTAAKNRFFQPSSEPSKLTVAAIEDHDAKDADRFMHTENDTASFKTWATNWTECTNTTFLRVHKNWQNDALHKEVLAVLAAVTEIIKSKGGHETELEYFAILMTTIETTEDPAVLSATIYLLSLVIKKVPCSVLQSKFSEISKVLVTLIEKHVKTERTAVLSKLISCLTTLLRVQDMATWTQPSTHNIYTGLLGLFAFPKPKVRKAVREAISLLLHGSMILENDKTLCHPAAAATAQFCISYIEKAANSALLNKTKDAVNCGDILQVLHVMKDVVGCFPRQCLKAACEMILRLLSLNNLVLKGLCLEVLNTMFHSLPPPDRLSPDINAKIITALYDFAPNDNDTQLLPPWLLVMENGHINLAHNDSELCLIHLPRIVSFCVKSFLSDRLENVTAAAVSLKSLLMGCLGEMDSSQLSALGQVENGPLHKIVLALQASLSYQYSGSWHVSLQVLGAAFEVLGKTCPSLISKLLPMLSDLRESPEFSYKAELDEVLGKAIRYMGPQAVLHVIPMRISCSGHDVARSWLMPILTAHVSDTQLSFFCQHFLTMAAQCRDTALAQQQAGNVVVQKVNEALVMQIWALLPGFCTRPTDLLQSFKGLAKTLGQAITDRPNIRKSVLSALRKLVLSSQDNDDMKLELSKYSKNYLPILFNVYTADTEDDSAEQQLIIETVKDYLKVTDTGLINTFFDKCLERLQGTEELSSHKRKAMMDLAISMVEYVNGERIIKLCEFVEPLLKEQDKTLQKKAYRFMESICAVKSDTCQEFVASHAERLQTMLHSNLSSAQASSKAPRLRCLTHLFRMAEAENRSFLAAVLPEAILCTKEVADAARRAAYDLIIAMCEALVRWNDGNVDTAVSEFLSLLVAGFAGSPQMIHSTILALTRVIIEYRKSISSENLKITMENCCTLLKSKSREVVPPALSLLKVMIGLFDVTLLAQHLQSICQSLAHMKDENRHHFRFKVKEILQRLIRKFGFEMVSKILPNTYEKQLGNIRKEQARKERNKALELSKRKKSQSEDPLRSARKSQPESVDELLRSSDSEIEDEEQPKGGRGSGQRKAPAAGIIPTWLSNDKEDITDFLDPAASRQITSSKPNTKDKHGRDTSKIFKIAPDGRMMITETEDEKPFKAAKGKAELDDLDEAFDEFQSHSKKTKKRKLEDVAESASAISTATYISGGRGIHRPLEGKRRANDGSVSGQEFKSKKADGDVKRKDKPDPYAYIPLNKQSLNKRKSAKTQGQFKNLIGGAKKGANSGRKGKLDKKRKGKKGA